MARFSILLGFRSYFILLNLYSISKFVPKTSKETGYNILFLIIFGVGMALSV